MKIIETIYDVETGKESIIERELTAAEIKANEQQNAETKELFDKAQEIASKKLAVLTKLGITEEEAKLLL